MQTKLEAWFPTIMKWTGLVLTTLCGLVWAVTAVAMDNAIEPPAALLAAFGTMFAGGAGAEAVRDLSKANS